MALIYCTAYRYMTEISAVAPVHCGLYFVLLLFFSLNRNYTPKNIFYPILFGLSVSLVLFGIKYAKDGMFRPRENTNFYQENYEDLSGISLKNKHKRNVIIVFVESFNDSMKNVADSNLSLQDQDAVSFSNFIEGPMQRWTQGALFSALTGTHINYIMDYWRYEKQQKITIDENKGYNEDGDFLNAAGAKYDFVTPRILSLSKIDKQDGYQNLFVQGGNLDFAGTGKLLRAHNFKYLFGDVELTDEIGREHMIWSRSFPGIDDTQLFGIFKQKVSSLKHDKPFLAIMFTLDFHVGFCDPIEKLKKQNIENLNDFIEWYKAQPFYDNTTLIILGDHNQMGSYIKTGAKIYNAFFNLPPYLPKDYEKNRTFNQIDMFPTVLEIMGYELPNHKAGMGTSLFSEEKTIAERYSYAKQDDFLKSHDLFYYNLWQQN